MKILVVNKFYGERGGAERVLFDLGAGYEARGHAVVPFAMASPGDRPTPWATYFLPAVDWDRGGPVARIRTAARVVWNGEAARRIGSLVDAVRPDVAHLHNFHHQLSPSIVDALRERGVPCVHTLHDYKVVCPAYRLLTGGAPCERCAHGHFVECVRHRCVRGGTAASAVAWIESAWHRRRRTLERGVAAFVAPSRFLAEKVAAMGFPGRPVHVVPNGVDLAARRVADRPGDGFLYAGRLAEEKGVGTLLRAVAGRPELRLAVAGDGPLAEPLRAQARTEAAGRVDFVGHLAAPALETAMRGARAVVLPSEWYENAPMTALEAAASGVPVIGARIGGIPEIVRDGETGLLFEPGDAEGLAEAMARLDAHPDEAARLGRAARAVAEREYGLDRQVDTMLDLLREVASSASR